MPIENVGSWSQFGLSGMVIAALFAFIWFLVNTHQSERKEWLAAYRDHGCRSDERQKETNEVIREISAVIRELTAMNRGG
jgi:hypothetical protein